MTSDERPDLPPLGELPVPVDHFEVRRFMAAGGMGAVYEAYERALARRVVLKFLKPTLRGGGDAETRFRREAQAAADLQHPNVVSVFYLGEWQGHPYFAMEYVDGQSLHDAVAAGPLSPTTCVDYMRQAVAGLRAAFKRGRIHRDIKPANLLLTRDGTIKVSDFGLARALSKDTRLTAQGLVMGTPHYISPEQARGEASVDCRSDIYSLGATFYHLACGQPPFDATSVMGVLVKQVNDPLPPLQTRRPELPKAFCATVETMLAKAPDERFADYDQLDEHLAGLAAALATAGDGAGCARPGATDEAGSTIVTGPTQPPRSAAPPSHAVATVKAASVPPADDRRRRLSAVAIAVVLAVVVPLALRAIGGHGVADLDPRRIAVLPFTNRTTNMDLDWLSTGMVDTIVTELAASPDLTVLARETVQRYGKIPDLDLASVAAELDCGRLVTGSFQVSRDTIRITCLVVAPATGATFNPVKVDGSLEDIFSLQDDMARQLKTTLVAAAAGPPTGSAATKADRESLKLAPKPESDRDEQESTEDLGPPGGGRDKTVFIRLSDVVRSALPPPPAPPLPTAKDKAQGPVPSTAADPRLAPQQTVPSWTAAPQTAPSSNETERSRWAAYRYYCKALAARNDGNHDEALSRLEQAVRMGMPWSRTADDVCSAAAAAGAGTRVETLRRMVRIGVGLGVATTTTTTATAPVH